MRLQAIARRGGDAGPKWLVTTLGFGLLIGLAAPQLTASAQECAPNSGIERVSIAANGDQSNDRSVIPAVNANGCVVGFKSYASNLVPGDTNEKVDVFVRDRAAGATERIPTVGFAGAQSNDNSFPPALDASGNTVAFGSLSNNLAPGDFNHQADIFTYDRPSKSIVIRSLALDGEGGGEVPDQPPSVTENGAKVVFTALSDNLLPIIDKNQTYDVFVTVGDTFELISQTTTGSQPGTSGNGPSQGGIISADLCDVAFYSDASNIVAQDTNEHRDVFVRSICLGRTERVSVASDGAQANGDSQASGFLPGISGDGNRVVFSSDATNLDPSGNNGATAIFVRDRFAGQTLRVSKNQNGESGNGPSQYAAISVDGRFVVFQSDASNLVDGDTNGHTDIFVVNVDTGEIRRVSVSSSGEEGNGDSTAPQISADGTAIVFQSDASNLVPGDTNGAGDIFIVSNPLGVIVPTPTPTAGESCGAVCATGQGCRREVGGETQDGECVPDRDCLCIVGGTETPTVTPTPTPSARFTPTAGESCGAVCSVGQGCRRQVGGVIQPGECVPDQNCLCIVGGTASPTHTPTFTPTAGDSCGAVFSVGQGCRRQVGGTIQPGVCVPDRNCLCIVGGTETPTPTRTPTAATPTPTAGDSCGAVCSVGQSCRRQVGGVIQPGECVPEQNCLCIVGGTPRATATPTRDSGGGGGGGGGCGCRIDPDTGRVADSTPWMALGLPAAVWLWRRRPRRS